MYSMPVDGCGMGCGGWMWTFTVALDNSIAGFLRGISHKKTRDRKKIAATG
jgi:hypothetical protein